MMSALRLVPTKAPPGKFRVIADNFGEWRTEHSDIHVGDFDTMEAAIEAAKPYTNRPYWEHFTVAIFSDDGKVIA